MGSKLLEKVVSSDSGSRSTHIGGVRFCLLTGVPALGQAQFSWPHGWHETCCVPNSGPVLVSRLWVLCMWHLHTVNLGPLLLLLSGSLALGLRGRHSPVWGANQTAVWCLLCGSHVQSAPGGGDNGRAVMEVAGKARRGSRPSKLAEELGSDWETGQQR